MKNLGIYGLGAYIPDEIRTNDYWPAAVVAGWGGTRTGKNFMNRLGEHKASDEETPPVSRATRMAMLAAAKFKDDPFKGAVERRIRPAGMKPSEMEIIAAKDALARSGIALSKVGLVLTANEGTDSIFTPNGPLVQKAIGAPSDCIATTVEAACNGFMMQLQFAQALIQTGAIEYAVLTQSCILPSILDSKDPFSAWFGDAATAVVVGPCDGAFGLMAQSHDVEADLYASMLVGNVNGPWWDGHPQGVYIADASVAKALASQLAELSERSLLKTLKKAGMSGADIDFMATHQATPWLRPVVSDIIGATNARSCDTFCWTGSVGPANVPLCMAVGEGEGLLKRGDRVVAWTGGAGTTHSSFALRFGV